MMKLSPRLKKIAEQINAGETMADIGTDHGFLPIYLWENKICPKVIMADISSGSSFLKALLMASQSSQRQPSSNTSVMSSIIQRLMEASASSMILSVSIGKSNRACQSLRERYEACDAKGFR